MNTLRIIIFSIVAGFLLAGCEPLEMQLMRECVKKQKNVSYQERVPCSSVVPSPVPYNGPVTIIQR